MYQMITLGGDAELELVDSLDPFTEGITFRLDTYIHTTYALFPKG
jgi:chromosome segregation ATPase